MQRSIDHIRSTHGGNLPRPAQFEALLTSSARSEAAVRASLPAAVAEVVNRQIQCGLDIVNDGEYVKASNPRAYSGYIHDRVTGWERKPVNHSQPPKRAGVGARDAKDFPGVYASGLWLAGAGGPVRPGFATPGAPRSPTTERVCTSAIHYVGQREIAADVAALKAALGGRSDIEGFVAALGPLSLGAGARNEHYANETDYMVAVAEALRVEYKAITDSGLILQVDEPEFATTWMFYPQWSIEQYRNHLDFCVDIINHALRGLPEEQIRIHMCWGSGHRPHVHDIEFRHIVDKLLKIDAQAYSFEASNVRHAHEYRVFEDVKLPEGKIIVPGVVGHYTDLVEHPELVAERLCNFARLVGMENVHAGTDCGIGSRVGHEEIAWAKLSALAEGAAIATHRLRAKVSGAGRPSISIGPHAQDS